MPYPAGIALAEELGMDDEARHVAETKQRLLERAGKLVGRDELARRLNVPSTLLEAWLRGDVTMPDGKLMQLARVLDDVSREEKG
jgi:DNA-binding transcriptional regulator YdaS (Cro superfamily)